MKTVATIQTIHPEELERLRMTGAEIAIVDVCTPPEFAHVRLLGSRNLPMDSPELEHFMEARLGTPCDPAYVICKGGVRSAKVCGHFAGANLVNVEGGTLLWSKLGLPIVRDLKGISLERQVRIIAGGIVLLASALGVVIHPYFGLVSAMIGGGLMTAGLTNSCAMAMVLAKFPWNKKQPVRHTAPSQSY